MVPQVSLSVEYDSTDNETEKSRDQEACVACFR
jgi:hypothetical protein